MNALIHVCKKPVVWVVIVTSLLTTSITIFFNIRKINTDLIKGTGAAVVKEEKTNYLLRSPAVIIAGTQKGGTTALRYYLGRHHQMLQSIGNEPHFFDRSKLFDQQSIIPDQPFQGDVKKIRETYIQHHFNVIRLRNDPQLLAFEKTPFYLFDPKVPGRVRKVVPWAKIIILLRDPVERAYSMFKMNYIVCHVEDQEEKYGKVNFETCIEVDIEKLEKNRILSETFWEVDDKEQERRWLSYWDEWDEDFLTREQVCNADIGRGLYYMQIQRWLQVYNDDDSRIQIFVTKSENLLPHNTTKKVNMKPLTDFIGIDEIEITAKRKIHTYVGFGPMKEETRKKLQKIFDPFNKELFSLLGDDWMDPWPYEM